MQALMEYTVRSRIREVTDLTVTIKPSAVPGFEKTFQVKGSSMASLQKIQVQDGFQRLSGYKKSLDGDGLGTLSSKCWPFFSDASYFLTD